MDFSDTCVRNSELTVRFIFRRSSVPLLRLPRLRLPIHSEWMEPAPSRPPSAQHCRKGESIDRPPGRQLWSPARYRMIPPAQAVAVKRCAKIARLRWSSPPLARTRERAKLPPSGSRPPSGSSPAAAGGPDPWRTAAPQLHPSQWELPMPAVAAASFAPICRSRQGPVRGSARPPL